VDEVQRVPVEMGYPEWNSAALSSPMRSNMADLNQQQQQQTYGGAASPAAAAVVVPDALGGGAEAAAAAAVTVAAAQERARLGVLGSREAVLPVQVRLVGWDRFQFLS
jgi:hypothetical protein